MAPSIVSWVAISLVCWISAAAVSADGWMQGHTSSRSRVPQLTVDAMRTEYIALEQALWEYLDKTANSQNNKETQLRKIFDSHRDFNGRPLMDRTFEENRYKVLNHYEWSLLERDLVYISKLYDAYKVVLPQSRAPFQTCSKDLTLSLSFRKQDVFVKQNNSAQLDELAVLDLTREILRNDKTISMPRILDEIERVMVQQTLYYRAMLVVSSQNPNSQTLRVS